MPVGIASDAAARHWLERYGEIFSGAIILLVGITTLL